MAARKPRVLANLCQFALEFCGRWVRLAPQNEVEKPNDKAINNKKEYGNQAWTMPDVPQLERNQGRSRKNYQ